MWGGGGALKFTMCTHGWPEVFNIYPNDDSPFWEKNTPKHKFSALLQPNFTPKQDCVWKLPLSKIEYEVESENDPFSLKMGTFWPLIAFIQIEFEVNSEKTTFSLKTGTFNPKSIHPHNAPFWCFCGRTCVHIANSSPPPCILHESSKIRIEL